MLNIGQTLPEFGSADLTSGNNLQISISGLSVVVAEVTNFNAAGLSAEYSMDGSVWQAAFGFDLILLDGQPSNIPLSNGYFAYNVSGWKFFRINCTAGSATVKLGSAIGAGVISAIAAYVFAKADLRDGNGNVITSTLIGSNRGLDVTSQGHIASGSADSGNPIKIGGRFNTALPTLTNGQRGDLQLDSNARAIIAPLTNSSVVKAQLQDNSGTAITLGQKAMSASVPIVLSSDQTGINTFLDKSGSGTITALNGTVVATTNGCSGVHFVVSGTWTATLVIEATVDGTNWFAASGVSNALGRINNSFSLNTNFNVSSGGFTQVRVRASVFTSGTVNISWASSAGNNIIEVYSSSFTNLSTQSRVQDGSGNFITSSILNAGTNLKTGLDVLSISPSSARYVASFALRQTTAAGANTTIFSMRNATGSTKTIFIDRLYFNISFNAASPVTRGVQWYYLQRFSAATPTGGTAITAGQFDSEDASSQVTDIRFLDTGLTTTGVTFETPRLGVIYIPNFGTTTASYIKEGVGIKLLPGQGLAIRLGVAAVVGLELGGEIIWSER